MSLALRHAIYAMIQMGECQSFAYFFGFSTFFSDHPRFKHDVGYRLSRAGLAVAYGQKVEFQGPVVGNIAYSTGSQTINITYTAVADIDLRSPNGFEVCCEGSQCLNESI